MGEMRRRTPPRTIELPDGRRTTTLVAQRCCNGCHREIGDANEDELDRAIAGLPLPDVRHECPWCASFLAEAADE